ncbi:MAG TPA: metal ABC transporter ATP-binding protein [Planctomycetota bacterium]|nr:metal ABC transporter ATP-binding protein [Planctomycetota bacterium]
MAALLATARAAFGYHRRAVVSGVDLTVERGDFLGIVGPNGAGKTTLFRGLLGLIPPLAGTVTRTTRAIGYVPQRETLDAIYPVTVEEVVRMGAFGALRGWRGLSREARERARACLERVGLYERRAQAFSSLSGGQRQRALIGRALMVEPELLLLDEPTSGVDRGAQARILELLIGLNRSRGMAVLLVSHQLAMVRETVQRVAWVADGGVRVGSAAELLAPEHLDRLYGGSGVARSLAEER